jgi:excisionase family DNA binding protein
MSDSIEIDKKLMNDIKSAAAATGYSRDYITKLARDGKIVATQVGRLWYVDLDSLHRYADISNYEQRIRQRHLSDQRVHEREIASRLDNFRLEKNRAAIKAERKIKLAVATVLVGMLFTSVALSVSVAPVVTSLKMRQLANVPMTGGELLASDTVFFDDTKPNSVFSDESVKTIIFAREDQGILILPKQISDEKVLLAADMFSDNVRVRVSGDGTMFISAADGLGRPMGSEVEFVTVPANQIEIP